MSRLYTRTGDTGQTGLLGGLRAPKTAARFDAIGTLDELNAQLGLAMTQLDEGDVQTHLEAIQADIFTLGAYLADPYAKATSPFGTQRIAELEATIDRWQEETPALLAFILPGGTTASAQLHVARAVARRAERVILKLHDEEALHPNVPAYLNRLSDLLFAAARLVAHRAGATETVWRGQP